MNNVPQIKWINDDLKNVPMPLEAAFNSEKGVENSGVNMMRIREIQDILRGKDMDIKMMAEYMKIDQLKAIIRGLLIEAHKDWDDAQLKEAMGVVASILDGTTSNTYQAMGDL